MSATIPLAMPDELLEIVREAASATGLSQQDVMRQGLKLGVPRLVEQLKASDVQDDWLLSSWDARARTIESFYDPSKAW
jgi:hypothetical protein